MRHGVSGRKLGRKTAHRWALFRNQSLSLVEHERIETTLPKAKEMRSFADHLITLGKRGDLSSRRQAYQLLPSKHLIKKLFEELAPRFEGRAGGYCRVLKLGFRQGDGAPMAFLEYLPVSLEGQQPGISTNEEAKSERSKTQSERGAKGSSKRARTTSKSESTKGNKKSTHLAPSSSAKQQAAKSEKKVNKSDKKQEASSGGRAGKQVKKAK